MTQNIVFPVSAAGFRRSFRLSRKDKKTNKSMYECKKSDQYDTADVPTYEEVMPYRRQTHEKYRLVVLVGECWLLRVLLRKSGKELAVASGCSVLGAGEPEGPHLDGHCPSCV